MRKEDFSPPQHPISIPSIILWMGVIFFVLFYPDIPLLFLAMLGFPEVHLPGQGLLR